VDEQSLLLVHRVLLTIEKEGLWRELQDEMEQDRMSGTFERLPEIVRQARAELRKA
jgi:chemotaxis protein histidine kinase CheA